MKQSFKFTPVLLLLGFIFLLGNSNSCGPVEEPLDHATAQQVEKIITDEMVAQEMIGAAVGIVKNGKIAFLKGYGYEDWEAHKPVTLASEFRWASMSKSLTAVAAMKLRESGKLDLNAPAKSYVGSYPHASVKVAQLLQNRGGVGHYAHMDSAHAEWKNKEENYPKNQAWNAAAAVNIFEDSPLVSEPGARYHYSTFGFILAGAVVESAGVQAYNKGYVQLVNEYIAQPLGMSSLKPDYVFDGNTAEAIGYFKNNDGDIQRRDDDDVTWKLPGGGFKSTITDVTRFVKGLANRQMLRDSTYELMWTKQADSNYSYGFGIEENGSNRRVAHSGSQTKTATYYVVVPESKLGVAVMCNSEWARPVILGKKILQALGVALSPGKYAWNCNAEDKSGYQYAGVWRKGNRDQVIRKGYDHDDFNEEWQKLSNAGYRLVDLETYAAKNGVRRWDGIFNKQGGRYALWRNFDSDGFHQKWQEMSNDSLRLIDLETYEDAGKRQWAGVFIEGGGKYALWRDFDFDGFHQKWQEMSNDGLHLLDLETYTVSGQQRWAGVFREGSGKYALGQNFDSEGFHKKWEEMAAQGMRLVEVEVYQDGDEPLWSGVWLAGEEGYYLNRNHDYCSLYKKIIEGSKAGYELLDLERY